MSDQIWSAIVGLVGIVIGGVGRDVVGRAFTRQDKQIDEATAIRKELYDEVKALRTEIARLDKELDQSRRDYYLVFAENVALKQEQTQLKQEHADLKAKYDEVAKEVLTLRVRQMEQQA